MTIIAFHQELFTPKCISTFKKIFAEGFKEAALKFQQEAGLQEPALCSSLDERIMIREAVQGGRIPEAISMVNALHPELLDNDRYLYFHLQVSL